MGLARQAAFASLILGMPATACAGLYRSEPIEAQVVDSASGRPVEGATVIANWQLEGGLDSGIPQEQLQILEALTDASGRFRLPGWGPKMAFVGQPRAKWPQILIFKPGYRHARLSNDGLVKRDGVALSPWHGKTIRLER